MCIRDSAKAAPPARPAAAREEPLPAPAPAPKPAQPRVLALHELPEAVRQQLPALSFSGATYSANPLYRMVIVNGQVLHEGDTAAPGVVLERIEPQQAVLRFKGYRYAVGY